MIRLKRLIVRRLAYRKVKKRKNSRRNGEKVERRGKKIFRTLVKRVTILVVIFFLKKISLAASTVCEK